jgi:hypothetical protein
VAEVYTIEDSTYAAWPGASKAAEDAKNACIVAYQDAIPANTQLTAPYYLTYYPTRESMWRGGNKAYVCLAWTGPDGGKYTGRLANN